MCKITNCDNKSCVYCGETDKQYLGTTKTGATVCCDCWEEYRIIEAFTCDICKKHSYDTCLTCTDDDTKACGECREKHNLEIRYIVG